jgi:formylglycine-generating enzyme
MRVGTASAILCLTLCAGSAVQAITIDWATVGNPGNRFDFLGNGNSKGAVNYTYRISKFEVTNAEYVEFLNAVAASDPHGLYNTFMNSSTRGGITRSGSTGNFHYAVKQPAAGHGFGGAAYTYDRKPVNFVSMLDAMRFANWLNNGQGNGDTEIGAHDMRSSGMRTLSAKVFLPSTDEWYKAAYHKNDGVTANYWTYATASDVFPNNNPPAADTGNSANFLDGVGNDYTTGNSFYPLTEVGAYTQSPSPYGTFDQSGNVAEWTFNGSIRGGHFGNANLASRFSASSSGGDELANVGFRVASYVPEPSTILLAALGAISLQIRKRY